MPKDKNIVEPIDAAFDEVVDSIIQPAGHKLMKINQLGGEMASQPAGHKQYVLDTRS